MKSIPAIALGLAMATGIATAPASAQQPQFELELNSLKPVETGCRLTYVARNATGTDLQAASFEVAVFDGEGAVGRLLILEFGALRDGKTKVVQFDLAGQDCSEISRLLVNDIAECSAAQGDAPDCMQALSPSSRTEVQFGL
ncbi:hypothetical protein [Aliiruegeria sabulilitoris]|uniref:hypothetical protein n=1 Tax=Aliiruegeria sabulilitoris TaxID=1510458 RepID=UPI001E4029B6|nr:hypothetical protein [Aliiruegeria sabulilitoris]